MTTVSSFLLGFGVAAAGLAIFIAGVVVGFRVAKLKVP